MGTSIELMEHQHKGVDYIFERRISYIGDDMGLGKTITALASIKPCNAEKVLIICPAYLKKTWANEAEKLGYTDIEIVSKRKTKIRHAQITILGYDVPTIIAIVKQIGSYDMVIFDEAHYLNGKKAKRTKVCLGTDRRLKYTVLSFTRRAVFLSGTPILNGPYELWPVLQAVYPKEFSSFTEYVYRYCGAYQGKFGLEYKGATRQSELKPYIDDLILRRKKEELLDLPDKLYKLVTLEKNREIEKLLKKEEDFNLDVERLMENKKGIIGDYATLRKDLGDLKIKASKEYLDDLKSSGQNFIVFTYHKDAAYQLSDDAITGDTSPERRQQIVERFQKEGGFIVGTYGGMGTGFTLTKATLVILLELHYSPMVMEQAIDRAYRIGQKNKITIHVLIWDGGIEHKLYKSVRQKRVKFNNLFENRVDN